MSTRPRARIRSTPEDFQVIEIPKVTPTDAGEHLLVEVRKRGANTAWVGEQLARWAGVPARAVSWAGLKDRHAVTEQWFSVHCPGSDPDLAAFAVDGVEILSMHRHARKLRRGALAGNRFHLVLRGLSGQADAVVSDAAALAAGFPNRFGAQRFGRGGGNIARARAWLLEGTRPRDRHQRGLLLSAARAELFNAVLDARIADGTWGQPLDGEVLALDGSGSHFVAETVDDTLRTRCAHGELHPTGPLCGRGGTEPLGHAGEVEREALAPHAALVEALAAVADADRRPLRVVPRTLRASAQDADTVVLEFGLPPGAYATTLLDGLVDWYEEDEADAGTDRT